jgi:hypothetical protein
MRLTFWHLGLRIYEMRLTNRQGSPAFPGSMQLLSLPQSVSPHTERMISGLVIWLIAWSFSVLQIKFRELFAMFQILF